MDIVERLSKPRFYLLFAHLVEGLTIFGVYRNAAFKLIRDCQMHKHHQVPLIKETVILRKFIESAKDVVIVVKFLEPFEQKIISYTFLMPLPLARTHLIHIVIIRLGISNAI